MRKLAGQAVAHGRQIAGADDGKTLTEQLFVGTLDLLLLFDGDAAEVRHHDDALRLHLLSLLAFALAPADRAVQPFGDACAPHPKQSSSS